MKAGILFTISLFFILFVSCKKDSAPESKPGAVSMHLHTFAGTSEVENYGDTITLPDGRKLTVTTAQLYISNVKLIKTDGGVVDGPSTIVLMQQGIEDYDLGDVPSGNYKSVRFDVGLSDAVNASTPVSTDPVLFQPSMWYGATAQPDGFVFLNFQGTIDTTSSAHGNTLYPFQYKIGTNDHRVTVTMPDLNYQVLPDQLTVLHLEADYAKILDGIQLSGSGNLSITTVEQQSWSWISIITNNIASMFVYEQ